MAPVALALAERTHSKLGSDQWRVVSDQYDITSLARISDEAYAEFRIWSVLDLPSTTVEGLDKLQVEVLVTLPRLERFLSDNFGTTFTNEFGKTVGIFLHRLLPNSQARASGFIVGGSSEPDSMSLDELARQLRDFGLPFIDSVTSGEAFLRSDDISPRLVEPTNWAVRRILYKFAVNPPANIERYLSSIEPEVVRRLNDKYSAIARVMSSVDAPAEVQKSLERYRLFASHMVRNPQLLSGLRQSILTDANP